MATDIIETPRVKGRFFAIPLSDATKTRWEDNRSLQDFSFEQGGIQLPLNLTKENLLIRIAQAYPKLTNADIKGIANEMRAYDQLRAGDKILGITAHSIEKAGFVVAVARDIEDTFHIHGQIEWTPDFAPIQIDPNVIDVEKGMQRITPSVIRRLQLPTWFTSSNAISELTYYSDAAHKEEVYAVAEPKRDPGGELEIFYGTNRTRDDIEIANEFYGEGIGELEVGTCRISIPPGHRQGELERPRKILFWQRNENVNRHIILSSVRPLSSNSFSAILKDSILGSEGKSALIFIHGFNTTFSEAAWRAGQIAYDLPFDEGVCAFFSWPSSGRTRDYARDLALARASIPALEVFIEKMAFETGVVHLHFIAHSMGNVVLTEALNKLLVKESFKGKVETLSQIILAAPDIDRDEFNNNILPQFRLAGKRRTLYVSDKDRALWFSRQLRRDLSRIGEGGEWIYVTESIDTVDASNVVSGGNNHSYMFEAKELLYDIKLLFSEGLEPVKRRLRQAERNSLKYWLFRE